MLNFDWLNGVSMEAARWVFLVLFVLIGVLVWLVPAAYVFEGVQNRRWWHDLRLWATGVLAFIFLNILLFEFGAVGIFLLWFGALWWMASTYGVVGAIIAVVLFIIAIVSFGF